MYNKVVLVGNLTRDIEMRHSQSGTAIANTAIATSSKFKDRNGEQKEEVMFIDISFFGRTAEVAHQYLKKGSKVLVDGRLKLDQWTDTSGQKRSKHSLVVESMKMLGTKEEAFVPQHTQTKVEKQELVTQQTPTPPEIELSFGDEELPF